MELIRTDQADAAARTLAAAFHEDPLMQMVEPDSARRTTIEAWFWRLPVNYGLHWGRVWGNEDASAVAIWLPPGTTAMSTIRMLRVGFAAMPVRIGLSGTRRFLRAIAATESFHKQVTVPHWYLLSVGTRPERQGQGLGSQLVELGTSTADAAGLPCYLETATAANVAFYEKRGFRVVGQAKVGEHTMTGMVRPPQSPPSVTD